MNPKQTLADVQRLGFSALGLQLSGELSEPEPEQIALIRPNKSLWLLPDGRVIDTEVEGRSADDNSFSHGIYVKNWVRFHANDPDQTRVAQAEAVQHRAKDIIKADPSLNQTHDDEGYPNNYAGDLAYNQAVQEQLGWIRVKPVTTPSESEVFFETATGKLTKEQERVMFAVLKRGYKVCVLSGGALNNRPGLHGGSIPREQL